MDFNKLTGFYNGKKVLITGNTGFKGSWMCATLISMGANVIGYSLKAPTEPSLFDIMSIEKKINQYYGDVRNLDNMLKVFMAEKPDIAIHMAAQPLVRKSYEAPVETYEVNVMGTVNFLECCRKTSSVKSVINVTTDKVYRNLEQNVGYVETDYLDGFDPYSNSKSCSELVTHSYIQSFFGETDIPVSTCRAGNVIGGGDFAKDRIVPDCFRAAIKKEDILIRNPFSIRPYEHVLEPVFIYLYIAMEQSLNHSMAGAYNIGPDNDSTINTGMLATKFCDFWNSISNYTIRWIDKNDGGPHEAKLLKLNCDKLKIVFDWKPVWGIDETIKKTVEWYVKYSNNTNMFEFSNKQIKEYIECSKK